MPAPMSPALQALCFFYRNPPPDSGVKPQPYKKIPGLLKAPHLGVGGIKMAVKRFHCEKKSRGRKTGWRKTTPAEDAKIFSCFQKVRLPLGSLVEARDVWKALPPHHVWMSGRHGDGWYGNSLEAQGQAPEEASWRLRWGLSGGFCGGLRGGLRGVSGGLRGVSVPVFVGSPRGLRGSPGVSAPRWHTKH